MKKIVVACAVALFAVALNAATCSWSISAIPSDPTSAAKTSYMAYLCDASVVSLSSMTDALSIGNVSILGTAGLVQASKAPGSTGNVLQSKFGDYTIGTTYDFYTIVLNSAEAGAATSYLASSVVSATAPSVGALQMGFGSQAANTWQAMTVPEPTSGLLLLLGMGALALRRKQA